MIPLAIALVMAAFIVYRVGASLDPRRKQRENTLVERLPSAGRRMRPRLRVFPPPKTIKAPELMRPPKTMPPNASPQEPSVEPWSADDWSSILRGPRK